jgi:hypothetical protein
MSVSGSQLRPAEARDMTDESMTSFQKNLLFRIQELEGAVKSLAGVAKSIEEHLKKVVAAKNS